MRVLYFSDNTSDHNRCFLAKLAQAGLDVWFLNPTTDHLAESWLPQGVRWVRTRQKLPRELRPPAFAEFLTEFQDWLREIRPDLIHAGPTNTCGYLTALSGFHPWLLATWGFDVLYQPGLGPGWRQATQFAVSKADGFLVDCDTVRAAIREFASVRDDQIVQFPWGITKGLFTPEGELPRDEEFTREPGSRVFISTRSWEPLYAIGELLDGFRLAHRKDSALHLMLMGDGSEAAKVHEFIAVHGLEGAIRMPGRVGNDEMPKWFRSADAYVSYAKTDSASLSLLEAMATGLPVIARDIPSNREWITEGRNGWLAPDGAPEELADRFLRAARLGAEERTLFSQRNRKIVEERADWDRNFPKLLPMYERLVAVPVKS